MFQRGKFQRVEEKKSLKKNEGKRKKRKITKSGTSRAPGLSSQHFGLQKGGIVEILRTEQKKSRIAKVGERVHADKREPTRSKSPKEGRGTVSALDHWCRSSNSGGPNSQLKDL